MAVFTVTSTAQALTAARADYPSEVLIQVPAGGATIYVDTTSAVTSATGVAVPAGSVFTVALGVGQTLYVLVASGTQDVRWMSTTGAT